MLDLYGNANGFGWKMDEVIGAQIVSVPMTVPIERAQQDVHDVHGLARGVFVAIFVLLNLMLYTMVIRRVTRFAGIADQVSLGNMEAGEFKTTARTRSAC
jgi:protein-histidine pros-kinase